MGKARIVLHVDMNSFYASVEQLHDPSLKGKPIAVAGDPQERKGIIVTASYEARARGVFTTQRVADAKRLCPELIIVPPHFDRYRAASKQLFSLLKEYTPLVEPVSIDEGYLDITEIAENRHALDIVEEIQQRIYAELGLPCSIGVAPNKFLAKTASDMKKPMGITVLRKRDVPHVLWPKEVITMHGIGKKTAQKLNGIGIYTIEQLAKADAYLLKSNFGVNGERMQKKANGEDNRAVDPQSIYDTKSVGNSVTLPRDESEYYILQETFEKLCEKVAERLKAKQLAGTTVIIYMRDGEWHNQTRSKSVQNALTSKEEIFDIAWTLFKQHWDETPLRLVGVTVSNVVDVQETTQQLDLFSFQQYVKEEPIIHLMHDLEKRFGKGVIQRGMSRPKKATDYANTSFSKDFIDDFHD